MTTATAANSIADANEIVRAIIALGVVAGGRVVEIRAVEATTRTDRYPKVHSGYFNDAGKAAAAVAHLTSAAGVYYTLNPVKPSLLARAVNRLKPVGKSAPTTSDH